MENLRDCKPKKNEGITARPQMDDYALFNTLTARFFLVNEVGYVVFNECDGEKSISEIVDVIYDKCIEKPNRLDIENDVLEMIRLLEKYELVKVSE
ncbi:PqqD family protein [Clostridium sp. 19966]|uniref:PqqD family protein n=1 Tax=Clostridium sp. 19966 TaxID=2768166 RepID=UPI0028DD7406|nr:PqqD family protein [Clostridium sp. 19966]MDT8717346.1 PqqD family protein [Clostridium sp. 19966]